MELLALAGLRPGVGETYFTLTPAVLSEPFRGAVHDAATSESAAKAGQALPADLIDVVQLRIEHLTPARAAQLETVAESLAMSPRSLQCRLAEAGRGYSGGVTETRLRRAADWLERSGKPIGEIAFDVGYADASNFPRAFRRRTGLTPQAVRASSRIV